MPIIPYRNIDKRNAWTHSMNEDWPNYILIYNTLYLETHWNSLNTRKKYSVIRADWRRKGDVYAKRDLFNQRRMTGTITSNVVPDPAQSVNPSIVLTRAGDSVLQDVTKSGERGERDRYNEPELAGTNGLYVSGVIYLSDYRWEIASQLPHCQPDDGAARRHFIGERAL